MGKKQTSDNCLYKEETKLKITLFACVRSTNIPLGIIGSSGICGFQNLRLRPHEMEAYNFPNLKKDLEEWIRTGLVVMVYERNYDEN